MPAVVFTAPYTDRSARVVCPEHALDVTFDRTASAQGYARQHNVDLHAYPEPLDLDTDQEIPA